MLADDKNMNTAFLIDKYGLLLRSFFTRRAPVEDADDLIQEVFLKLQSTKARRPIENIEGYLFATAHSVLIDYGRAKSRRRNFSAEFFTHAQGDGDSFSPERIAIGQEEYLCVMHAISELPPRTRQAFELHRFENLTYNAISEKMGISKESVKELMHRALLRIAEELRAIR